MEIGSGKALPLGVTVRAQEVNFSLFAKHATSVTLALFDYKTKKEVGRYNFDLIANKTGDIWHIALKGLTLPLLYGYYIDGNKTAPNDYDPKKILLDPYAKKLEVSSEWGKKQVDFPLGVICQDQEFDWQNVTNPKIPLKDLIIYEMHVRGFTQDNSSQVKNKGTYLGIIEKIPYLVELGITAVELMPIFEFDETRNGRHDPETGLKLCNFWGYATLNFFCPMQRFASEKGKAKEEFQTMVRELHRNKIEVILDVVFNHSGESKNEDDYLSFLGIDKQVYYLLYHNQHTNFSGCGNTMQLAHPVMQNFVIDCLHYWAAEMRVDGFRFDLATIMNRGMHGELLHESALIQRISHDPILSEKKLIAEPWDAAAGYQLGGFSSKQHRWSEWNDQYKIAVRKFVRGDPFSKNGVADRITGSSKNFYFRTPQASINFITAHDGFTLNDLVSYNQKHNLNNGEENNDGDNNSCSWNCGVEGIAKNPDINRLREKQQLNFFVLLFLSFGVPMILMGDEYGHTKRGNNNTWCHENLYNTFFWDKIDPARLAFLKKLIKFRKEHPLLTKENFPDTSNITWHGLKPFDPAWEDPIPLLGFEITSKTQGSLFVFCNPTPENYDVILPEKDKHWQLIINTHAPYASAFLDKPLPVYDNHYLIPPYTIIVLQS